MTNNNKLICKDWVPAWLLYVSMSLLLLPIAAVLGIYMGGASTAASYYGVDAIDIRYSVVLYYFGIASIFPMESKFFNFFSSKPYLVACVIIYILVNIVLYNSHSFVVLLIFRYLGGAVSHGIIGGIMFTLVFRQFHEQRSRVLGYATMYAILLGTAPLAYILDAYLFSNYDFNSIFLFKIYSVIPGLLLMCWVLRNDFDLRNNGKIPLHSIDWISYILYAACLILFAYFLLYGQYYHWFYSQRITLCFIGSMVLLILFVVRQIILKEPYINLKIYKTRNFRIGMVLLIFFYFGKGDLGILSTFISHSVNLDVYSYGYVMLINVVGIVCGAVIGSRYLLAGTRIRIIWMLGFGSLLTYYVLCLGILNNQAETSDLFLPLFLHGFGNGALIVSIVIFYVTAVPPEIGPSAAVTGVAFRACTFTANMAVSSLITLRFEKIHYQSLSGGITRIDPEAINRIGAYQQALLHGGISIGNSHAAAMELLGKTVETQDSLLAVRDYYLGISYLLGLLIVLIAAIPHFQYHIKKIRARLIPI